MSVRGFGFDSYGWAEAEADLSQGVHPGVVAARLGEPEQFVRDTAEERGWAITFVHDLPSPDEMLERYNKLYGFDA